MKIANRISLSFLIVSLIVIALAGPVIYFITRNNLRDVICKDLNESVDSRANHIETYLKMLKISVGQLSESTILENFMKSCRGGDPRRPDLFAMAMKRLKRTSDYNSSISELFMMDATGKVRASSNESCIGNDESADDIFLGARRDVYIKDAYLDKVTGEPVISVSTPIFNRQTGEFLGVLAARVKLDVLNSITTDKTGMGKMGEIYIVNKYGYMVTPSRFRKDTFLKQKVETENVRQIRLHIDKTHPLPRAKRMNVFTNYLGRKVLGAHAYIPEMHWGVLAEIDIREAFAPLAALRLIFIIVLMIVPFITWLLGVWVAHAVTAPIHRLHQGIEIIGRGNLDYTVGTEAKDEVGQLSRAFDTMTANLKKSTTSIGALNREIIARAKMEEKLQESEKRFFDVLYASQDAILLIDRDKFVDCNEATVRMLGYSSRQDFLMTHPSELSPTFQPDGKSSFEKANEMMDIAYREGFNRFEWIHRKANGEDIPVEVSLTPVAIRGESLLHCHWRDMSEKQKMWQLLQKSEEQFRAFFESSKDALLTLEPPSWKFTSGNPAALNMYMVKDKDTFVTFGPWDLSPEFQPDGRASVEKAKEMIEIAMRDGSHFFEWVHRRTNGEEFPSTVLLTRIDFSGVVVVQATVRDITKEKKYEQQLMNDKNILEIKSKEADVALKEALRSREILSSMLEDNSEIRDKLEQSIAEVQKNHQMVLQSEKLASIGQLAAGIAHEINNPTGFIGSNISTMDKYMTDITRLFRVMETLKVAVEEGDLGKAQKIEKEIVALEKEMDIAYIFNDVDNLLRETQEGVDRIGNIVRDLKTFSHSDAVAFTTNSLCKIIDSVLNIVWNEIKYKAELKKDYVEDLMISCNPQQLGQVFINILVNAAQAIKDKGVITVKTYSQDGKAHVDISDTGCGISEEDRSRIFDPFFTTKAPGKGTGLGLGISAEIVKKHGGSIALDSVVGKGTTFKIILPFNLPAEENNAKGS